jgi:hypothetical protein
LIQQTIGVDECIALMAAASFCVTQWSKRYSGQQENASIKKATLSNGFNFFILFRISF